jgi:hypothetical protein
MTDKRTHNLIFTRFQVLCEDTTREIGQKFDIQLTAKA